MNKFSFIFLLNMFLVSCSSTYITYRNGYVIDKKGNAMATYNNGYILSEGKYIATYSNGYIFDNERNIIGTYSNGYVNDNCEILQD